MKGLKRFMLKHGPTLTVLSKFSLAVEETAEAMGLNFEALDTDAVVELTRAILLTLGRLDAEGSEALTAAIKALESEA